MAFILREKMEELKFVFMLELWNRLLNQFHKNSKSTQDSRTPLSTCAKLFKALLHFLGETRKTFDDIEYTAKEKLPNVDYKIANTRKITGKGNVGDGDAPNADETLSSRDKFRVKSFIPIMGAL
jgi:hypothetical protein